MNIVKSHLNVWGNGYGVRIPKEFRDSLQLTKGTELDLILDDGKIIIKPVNKLTALKRKSKVSLKELVDKITPENMHDFSEFDTKPVGKEVW